MTADNDKTCVRQMTGLMRCARGATGRLLRYATESDCARLAKIRPTACHCGIPMLVSEVEFHALRHHR